MSSSDEMLQKLQIIELQIEALTALLPPDKKEELDETVSKVKDMLWERRMGEDL